MINIKSVLQDPVFLQSYQIERQTGVYIGEGDFQVTSEFLDRSGSIQPAKSSDIMNFLPEGLRSSEAIQIWDQSSVLMEDGVNSIPDVVHWLGLKYRVAYSKHWETYGYWYAIATRFKG